MSEAQKGFNIFEPPKGGEGFTRRTVYQVECNRCGMVKTFPDEIIVRDFISTHRCGVHGSYDGRVVKKHELLFGNPKEAADGS